MTSLTDTTGHPDVAEISDFSEGLLPPFRTTEVRRHLDACDLCADVHRSLEEIRGLLGTLPGPPQMPADVADRIDASLAAEALLAATAPGDPLPRPVPASASPSGSDESTETHVSRETSAPVDRPAGRPHGATGPGRKARRRGRRGTVVMGAVLTAAVLGAGSLLYQTLGTDRPDTTAQGRQTPTADAFSEKSLQSQVSDLLTTQQDSPHGSGSQRPRLELGPESRTPGTGESADTLLHTSAPVPDCIRQGINSNADILGAKQGTYDGKDAYLVVLPDADDSTRVNAYVVDAACVDREPVAPGTVLWKQSFTRS
ncbi:anti-sigma factor family protein [Streptomyces sp. NPDC004629]|uniref:anti-sigma factor family protein n=1 Tax=Streptomyces sp. NPDC004629 TaxID=3364705 RepID=UPI00368E7EAD